MRHGLHAARPSSVPAPAARGPLATAALRAAMSVPCARHAIDRPWLRLARLTRLHQSYQSADLLPIHRLIRPAVLTRTELDVAGAELTGLAPCHDKPASSQDVEAEVDIPGFRPPVLGWL